jgi:hypothetical protein
MPLPLAAAILWLAPISYNTNGLIGDWYGLVYYGVLLLYGSFLFGSPELLAALNRQRFLSLSIGVAAYAVFYVIFVDGAVRPVIRLQDRPAYALLSAFNAMAGCSPSSACQPLPDAAAGLPRRGHRGGLSVLHAAPDRDGDRGLLAAPSRRAAGGGVRPRGSRDLPRNIGDLCLRRAPAMVRASAVRAEGGIQQEHASIGARELALAHHSELFQRALTGNVFRTGDRHHAVEAHDIESESERGTAEFRPVALALRVRREGAAQGDAVAAVMDAQAAESASVRLRSVVTSEPKAGHSAS